MSRKNNPSPFVLAMIGHVFAIYLWIVERTLRWEMVDEANHQSLCDSGKGFICASWHGRLLMLTSIARRHPNGSVALSSNHKDADIMVAIFKRIGIDAVRGSSSNAKKPEKKKGGAGAFRRLLTELKNNKTLGMTPDGPRGPAFRAELGTVQLSRMAQAPIIPIAFSTRHSKRFSGWDSFMVPLPVPFGKAYVVFGEPFVVSARGDLEMEDARAQLERALNDVTLRADQLAGVEPDPTLAGAVTAAMT